MLKERASRFPLLLEVFVWFFYVCLYKYGYYLQLAHLPNKNYDNFPHLSLMLYALAMTLYIIPFYRYIVPALFRRKRYAWMFVVTVLYFAFVPKLTNWLVSYAFMQSFSGPVQGFYVSQFNLYRVHLMHLFTGWDLKILLTDCIAFLSLSFTRYAFAVEQGKRLLEREYFRLQVEGLKAQLNPHFLFNMLNSIYGMSLSGSPDTPSYILRMSDMMRYILYDGRETTVPIEKDLQFVEHYIAMEKKRYPEAHIDFTIVNDAPGQVIVPLLLIPFIENSFKHGAHRVNEKAVVQGNVTITKQGLNFILENDSLPADVNKTKYGGVGIENVKQRLALYYPGQHELTITVGETRYSVRLIIKFKP
jgi:sensor histidine kinase YesM